MRKRFNDWAQDANGAEQKALSDAEDSATFLLEN